MTEEMQNYCVLSNGCLRKFYSTTWAQGLKLRQLPQGFAVPIASKKAAGDTENSDAITETPTKQGSVAQFPVE